MTFAKSLGELDARVVTPAHLQSHFSKGRLKFFAHIQAVQRFFWRLESGEITRGMIFMPPQHGKSEYVCGAAIPWSLGRNPNLRVGLVSHGAKLAKKWGGRALDFFLEHGQELYGLQVNPRRRAAENWGFSDHAGGMITCGIGGSLVGEPIDFGVIDDHFKNAEDANSPAKREKIWDWYCTVFLTRLSQNARVLLINTRWHPDDLCGRLLQLSEEGKGEHWEVLNLAAICPEPDEIPEEDHSQFFPDPLGREAGEALCPQLHSKEKIQKARETQGEAWFWAVNQGRPTPGKGNLIREDQFRYYEWSELPCVRDPKSGAYWYPDIGWRFDDCIQSWDTKFSKQATKSGSWVCGQVWGRKGANKYLLDEVRGRWGVEDTIDQVRELTKKWPIAKTKLFEPKASGPEIVTRLQHEITGMQTYPVAGDKEARMRAQEHHFRGSNVWLPAPGLAGWMRAYRQEICQFPRGIYNDRVDSTSQALHYFDSGGLVGAPEREDKPTHRERLGLR